MDSESRRRKQNSERIRPQEVIDLLITKFVCQQKKKNLRSSLPIEYRTDNEEEMCFELDSKIINLGLTILPYCMSLDWQIWSSILYLHAQRGSGASGCVRSHRRPYLDEVPS